MELYKDDIITTQTINDILSGVNVSKGTTSDVLSDTAINVLKNKILYGGTIMKASYKSAITGARVEIFPDYDKTIGFASYNQDETVAFKTIVAGTDVGDVIIGDYDGGQGIKWDASLGTLDVAGDITANSLAAGSTISSPVITGGTITGGVLQTSANGLRVKINGPANAVQFLYNDTVYGDMLPSAFGGVGNSSVAIRTIAGDDGTVIYLTEGSTINRITFVIDGSVAGYLDATGFHNGAPA
jgi:hypothetical protein